MERSKIGIVNTRAACIALAFVFASSTPPNAHAAAAGVSFDEASLCEALDSIASGEQRHVRVSGVFRRGFEHATLAAPNCSRNVQPLTWVEFESGAAGMEELLAAQTLHGAVLVVVSGTLHGPIKTEPGPQFHPKVRARLRVQRHGHLNGYRTKLVVSNVENVTAPVPGAILTTVDSMRSSSPAGEQKFPTVTGGQAPTYPQLARINNTEGDVELELVILDGRVADARIISGDELLGNHAVGEARSWQFEPNVGCRVFTKFSYRLEKRSPDENQNPNIEMQLPQRVTLVAPPYKW